MYSCMYTSFDTFADHSLAGCAPLPYLRSALAFLQFLSLASKKLALLAADHADLILHLAIAVAARLESQRGK